MARKDLLAAGARSAQFVGAGKADDKIVIRNVMSDEDAAVLDKEQNELLAKIAETTKPVIRKKFIPNKGVLLVRRIEVADPQGILLADSTEKEKPAEGIVLEVGKSAPYSIGDHLVFGKYSGTEFKLNGEILLLIEVGEIKGILVDEDPSQLN